MTDSKRPLIKHSGVQSSVLIDLVKNTAPFLFEEASAKSSVPSDADPAFRYIAILRAALMDPPAESDLWSYFELCIASHFATVGTFVPTDVDVAIREKLWSYVKSEASFIPMWERVSEFKNWDESRVSNRQVKLPDQRKLSGHQGEWLTLAMGAYGTAKRIASAELGAIREAIEEEVKNEERVLTVLQDEFLENPTSVSMKRYLSGAAAVAHNLGDLDRMFTSLEIEETDVLRRRVYRSAHEDTRNPKPVFLRAGKIYQTLIASENHRNFALRAPKALRKSADFLLPFGLFLDEWGEGLVKNGFRSGRLTEGDLREVIEALVTGWKKLNPVSIYTAQGYSRALVGMAKALGGKKEIENFVPPAIRKDLNESGLRTLVSISQEEFEKKYLVKLKVAFNSFQG